MPEMSCHCSVRVMSRVSQRKPPLQRRDHGRLHRLLVAQKPKPIPLEAQKATHRSPYHLVIACALALNRCLAWEAVRAGADRRTDLGIAPRCLGVLRGSLQDHQLIQWLNDSHNFLSMARGTVTGTSPPIRRMETTTSPRPFLLGVTTFADSPQNGPSMIRTRSPECSTKPTTRSAS